MRYIRYEGCTVQSAWDTRERLTHLLRVCLFKAAPGHPNVAVLELDFNSLVCLGLGIKSEDNYDYAILQVLPIPNTHNYTLVMTKFIATNGYRTGKHSKVNYARIEQENFRRYNNGNGGDNNRHY